MALCRSPPRGRERGIDREKGRRRKRKVDLMAVGAVAAVPVLAPNLLHVVEKEEQTERKIRRGRPDGSWHCSRSPCPRTQPPPRGREEEQTERKNEREVDLMAVGTIAAVPVLAPNFLHMAEKEEQTERKTKGDREKDKKRKREVDLMAVGAIAAVLVLAPNLLHVVEKEE